MPKSILNIILLVFLSIWLLFFAWVGFGMFKDTDKQIKKDQLFITKEIMPAIKSIDSFKTANHRLPTATEFAAIKHEQSAGLGKIDYIRDGKNIDSKISDLTKNTDWSKNYVLAFWRGERWEYYISAGDNYITNDYNSYDGAFAFLICSIIGCLPLGLYLWFNRSKGKKQI